MTDNFETKTTVENQQENSAPQKKLIGLRIPIWIIMGLATAFWIYTLIDVGTATGDMPGLGAAIVYIMYIVYGTLSYLVPLILSIIGVAVSAKKKEEYAKGTKTFFTVFLILSIVVYVTIFIAFRVVIASFSS